MQERFLWFLPPAVRPEDRDSLRRALLVVGGSPIRDGFIALNNRPGHGLTLNEDVAKAHLKKGSSYFGDNPNA